MELCQLLVLGQHLRQPRIDFQGGLDLKKDAMKRVVHVAKCEGISPASPFDLHSPVFCRPNDIFKNLSMQNTILDGLQELFCTFDTDPASPERHPHTPSRLLSGTSETRFDLPASCPNLF